MKNEALIQALARDLKRVRRLASVDERALRWAAVAGLGVLGGSWALGARADLAARLHEPSFVLEGLTLVVVALLAGRGALRLSVPGEANTRVNLALPWCGLAVWLSLIVGRYLASPVDPAGLVGTSCLGRMLWLSCLPTLALVVMLRKAAPFVQRWTGLTALLAGAALAMLGTQLVCAKDEPTHVLLWHLGPLLGITLAGAGLGKRLFPEGGAPRSKRELP